MFPSSPFTVFRLTNIYFHLDHHSLSVFFLLWSQSFIPYPYFIFFQKSLLELDSSSIPEFTVSLLSFSFLVSLTFSLCKPLGFYIVSCRTNSVYRSHFFNPLLVHSSKVCSLQVWFYHGSLLVFKFCHNCQCLFCHHHLPCHCQPSTSSRYH